MSLFSLCLQVWTLHSLWWFTFLQSLIIILDNWLLYKRKYTVITKCCLAPMLIMGFCWYIVYNGWNTMHYISLKYHFCTIHILPYIRLIQCIFVYIGGNPWPRISVYNSRREFYISIWLLGSSWTLKLSVNLSML